MPTRSLVAVLTLVALVAGCGNYDGPPTGEPGSGAPPPTPSGSLEPQPTEVPGQLTAAWRPSPIQLGDPQIAVISDACATAAREQLGEPEANLPTALVDARGQGLATAILADEERAIQCLVMLDEAGTATVDSVARLASSLTKPQTEGAVALTSLVGVTNEDGQNPRILLIGRVGPTASGVKVRFAGGPEVTASSAGGWYAAWWPGETRATAIDATDSGGAVVGTLNAPAGPVDGRLGKASWWLDPKAPAPTPDSIVIRGFVMELACASGKTPAGRLEQPLVDLTETAVTVTFGIRPLPGDQDCQGNEPFPITFRLPEALANRTLFDGNDVPPRNASKLPAG